MQQPELDPSTLKERLAGARAPDEVMQILGRRRILQHTLAFLALGAGFGGYAVYMIAQVAVGHRSGWGLAALPAYLAVAAFFGVIAYGGVYMVATGHRAPGWRGSTACSSG